VRRDKDGVPVEAVITANVAHPYVVRTIAHATAVTEPGSGFSGARTMAVDCTNSGSAPAAPCPRGGGSAGARAFLAEEPRPALLHECWLLLEYADCGSLMARARRGPPATPIPRSRL